MHHAAFRESCLSMEKSIDCSIDLIAGWLVRRAILRSLQRFRPAVLSAANFLDGEKFRCQFRAETSTVQLNSAPVLWRADVGPEPSASWLLR